MAKQNAPAPKNTPIRSATEGVQQGLSQNMVGQRPLANLGAEELEQIQRAMKAAKWPLRKTPGEVLSDSDAELLSDAPAWSEDVIVSQAGGVEAASSVTSAGSGVSAASTTTATSTGLGAVGTSAGAAGAVASSAAAAASATAATTTSIAATTTVASASSVAGVVGGVALAGGGGGGGSTPQTATPPSPPDNPYPGSDPETLDLTDTPDDLDHPDGNDPARLGDVHRTSVAGTTLPSSILYKSLVIDLGATYGPLYKTLYHTQRLVAGGPEVTHVLNFTNIDHVTGTAVNDQITGHSGSNVLDGGSGNDIIYGDGGADTLIGGSGNDWVLFNPLTRSYGVSPYNTGVTLDLAAGTYTYAALTGNAVATQFENAVGSNGNDTLLGTDEANVLDGAGGDDWIEGGDGNDVIYDGAHGTRGNQLWGGADADIFKVGYSINPVIAALNPGVANAGVTYVAGYSVIRDWETGTDQLLVALGANAVIGGLGGDTNWSVDNTVDLRQGVTNLGQIHIAAGAGVNQIWGSTGADHYHAGYAYAINSNWIDGVGGPTATGGTDKIWTWDDSNNQRDTLSVASGAVAVIAGLQGKADFSGNDTVDLRVQVSNAGTVAVALGDGNNIFRGSTGVDAYYGSTSGFNQVWGGGGSNSFWIGYGLNVTNLTATAATSVDVIRDFDLGSTDTNVDTLHVSALGVAVLAGLRQVTSWDLANAIDLGDTTHVLNSGVIIMDLGASNDTFKGSQGADHVYGASSGSSGNQIWGRGGRDIFYSGYNYAALVAGAVEANGQTEVSIQDTANDAIRDWENGVDGLVVGARGRVVIGGLKATGWTDWTGNDTINLQSQVNNQGVIVLAAGQGTNHLYGSSGKDQYWVGYAYTPVSDVIDVSANPVALSSGSASDYIWAWDGTSTRPDTLTVSASATAHIAGLQGVADWTGNDTVDLRLRVDNSGLIVLAAGAGANRLYGSTGSDEYNVGYQFTPVTGALANVTSASDAIDGWDARQWSGTTWYAGTNWNGATNTSDGTYDRLNVRVGSSAFIASLSGMDADSSTRWDGNDTVDLRSSVGNAGEITVWTGSGDDIVYGSAGRDLIFGGSGLDNVYGGAGNDVFNVGYSPSVFPAPADAAETRIWDWQDASTGAATDGLRIDAGSFAVIAGLYGMNPLDNNRWSGPNSIDLRNNVENLGKIILETGGGESTNGNDTIYGSSGVDYILAGKGLNTYYLDNGGADRVYIDDYMGQHLIQGFSSDDKIYFDKRILELFDNGISLPTGYDNMATSYKTGVMTAGQAYDSARWLTSLTYNGVYNGILSVYNSTPRDPDGVVGGYGPMPFGWQSNSAWNNDVHNRAFDVAEAAVFAAAAISLGIGNGLVGIPFVGPLLALPFYINGGIMIYDGITTISAHQNPTYDVTYAGASNAFDAGINILSSNVNPLATSGWNAYNFLDFYQKPSDRFLSGLEIVGHQPAANGVPLTGITSFVTVYDSNGDETFIYLVASKDGIIENNETRLIAQVNGQISANQLVMFDGATDTDYLRYFDNAVQAPVFAAVPTVAENGVAASAGYQVLYQVQYTQSATNYSTYVNYAGLTALRADNTVSSLFVNAVATDDNTPTVTISFDKALVASDTVKLYSGTTLVNTWTNQTGSSISFTTSALADGLSTYSVVVINEQGFEAQCMFNLTVDTAAPDATKISIADTASSLVVTSNEAGALLLKNGGTTVSTTQLTGDNGYQGQISLTEQSSSAVTYTLDIQDVFGHTTSPALRIVLGTASGDSITGSASIQNDIYGFGGADTLHAGNQGDVLYGGAGQDTLYDGTGADKIYGGAEGDSIYLTSDTSSDTLLYAVSAGNSGTSDSYGSSSATRDVIHGFDWTEDIIAISATNVSSFNPSVHVSLTAQTALADITKYDFLAGFNFNNDGDTTDSGDLALWMAETASTNTGLSLATLLSRVSYDLTGTNGADTLVGGAQGDRLSGGAGADVLAGGSGADTYVFAAGDTTLAVSGANVTGYDAISGTLNLTDSDSNTQNHDVIDLAGSPTVAKDVASATGAAQTHLQSHSISNGVIKFDDVGTYAFELDLYSIDLSEIFNYLSGTFTGASYDGYAVAFKRGSDSYLFQNNEGAGNDLLILLSGSAGSLAGLTTDPQTANANYLFIS